MAHGKGAAGAGVSSMRSPAKQCARAGRFLPGESNLAWNSKVCKRLSIISISPRCKPSITTVDPKIAAAIKIQSIVRMYLAKQMGLERARRKKEQEELMDKLEKEAWLQMIKFEREAEEKRTQAEMERKRKIQEKLKNEKALREAAFDGEISIIKDVRV